MNHSVIHLLIYECKVSSHVPAASSKALEAEVWSKAILLCLSYEKISFILEDRLNVNMTCQCVVREDMFHMTELQNAALVFSSKLEKSLLHDYDEVHVDNVVNGHGPSEVHAIGEYAAPEKDNGDGNLHDSSPHHDGSEVIGENSAKKFEESQTPRRRTRRARWTPLRFSNTVMMAAEVLVTYEKSMKDRMKNEWNLTLKEELAPIERS